jgi:ribosomal protein S14
MRGKQQKDLKNRKKFFINEDNQIVLKSIILNENLPENIKLQAQLELQNLKKNSLLTRIKNRCIFSNRSRAIYKDFKMSRIYLKSLGNNNLLPGIIKASW